MNSFNLTYMYVIYWFCFGLGLLSNVCWIIVDCSLDQVGCGAGNTIFPLIDTYPDIFVHACDFSPRAVDLVKVSFYLYLFY